MRVADELEKAGLVGVVEWRVAAKQDEEDAASGPHVDLEKVSMQPHVYLTAHWKTYSAASIV